MSANALFWAEELTLLPAQLPTPAGRALGARRLASALLEDLFTCKQLAKKESARASHYKKLVTLDQAWVAGAPALLPFTTICEALGLDVDRVRRAYHDPHVLIPRRDTLV